MLDRIAQDHRAVDPDRRAPRQRARHRRAVIQRQGNDRILVQVPGLQDPTRLKEMLGKTAKMEFRMVDRVRAAGSGAAGTVAAGIRSADERLAAAPTPYVVKKQVLVAGGDLTDAQPSFDQRTSEPVVSFKFNTSGARKFAQATQENVGLPFAIVLDNKVISAPVIREPITGGRARSPAISRCNRPTISRSCCAPARCRRRSPWSRNAPSVRASARIRSRRASLRPMSARSWSSSSCC